MQTIVDETMSLQEWLNNVSEPMEGKDYELKHKVDRPEWVVRPGSREALNLAIGGRIRQNEEERIASMNAAGNIIIGSTFLG